MRNRRFSLQASLFVVDSFLTRTADSRSPSHRIYSQRERPNRSDVANQLPQPMTTETKRDKAEQEKELYAIKKKETNTMKSRENCVVKELGSMTRSRDQ